MLSLVLGRSWSAGPTRGNSSVGSTPSVRRFNWASARRAAASRHPGSCRPLECEAPLNLGDGPFSNCSGSFSHRCAFSRGEPSKVRGWITANLCTSEKHVQSYGGWLLSLKGRLEILLHPLLHCSFVPLLPRPWLSLASTKLAFDSSPSWRSVVVVTGTTTTSSYVGL